jgi:hypothetical protein
MEVKLTKDDLETLYMCRNKAREVVRMERKVNSFLPVSSGLYKSPQMTGMPGARDVHGLDGSSRKNEAEFQALERAKEEYEGLSLRANRIICSMDYKMHDFCVAYFVKGEDIGVVADSIGVDRSTCHRKLNKLHGGNSNFRRLMENCNKMQQIAT